LLLEIKTRKFWGVLESNGLVDFVIGIQTLSIIQVG